MLIFSIGVNMNLILIDGDEKLIEIAKKSILSEYNQIEEISNWSKLELTKFDKIFLITKITNNFVSFETQSLILECKIKLKIVVVYEAKSNEIPFVSWINSLANDGNQNLSICLRIDYYELEKNINQINDTISGNDKEKKSSDVTIYTDGACSGNPGAGGWGVILMANGKYKEASGYEPDTTNNRMELTAVIKALSILKKRCNVELYSDSAYVVNAINKNWLSNWKNNGWKNSGKESVKNIELWQELDTLLNYHSVNFIKVKGHSDNEYNNRCDMLATSEISNHQIANNN